MNTKIKKYLTFFLFFSFLLILLGYTFLHSYQFGVCASYLSICAFRFELIGEPMFYGGIALSIVFFVLLFTHEYAFSAWKKFAIWYVPIAALIMISFSKLSEGSFFPEPDPSTISYYLSVVYVVVSVLIIAVQFFRRGRKS